MSQQELREIDARVAHALGYRFVAKRYIGLSACAPEMRKATAGFESPQYIANPPSDWEVTPLGGYVSAQWPKEPDGFVPCYTTDPAAADLVRREIEKRGWEWCEFSPTSNNSNWEAHVDADPDGTEPRGWHERGSDVSSHHALCRAFLAAVEAEAQS